jgi:hypothetical protein
MKICFGCWHPPELGSLHFDELEDEEQSEELDELLHELEEELDEQLELDDFEHFLQT